jgi:methyltransferase (TIGR00027 family)
MVPLDPGAADGLIRHVSDTAFLVAHHRAVESARPDALFPVPLAAPVGGARGQALAEGLRGQAMSGWTVALRTRLIDEYVSLAIARGVDTVLNLGAGLDTRPYRLRLPAALTFIEVDHPEVIAFKEQQLRGETPRCRLERVGLDLGQVAARRQLLANVDARAGRLLVLTEGVLPYLSVEEAAALADDLRALRRVESWIVDYVSPQAMAYRRRSGVDQQMREAPFKFTPDDWHGFFRSHGWGCREMRYLPDEGRRHARRPPLPLAVRLLLAISRPFTSPARREGFRTSMGYALLEPVAR